MITVKENKTTVYEVDCPKCQSILNFNQGDKQELRDEVFGTWCWHTYIWCPCCNSRIFLDCNGENIGNYRKVANDDDYGYHLSYSELLGEWERKCEEFGVELKDKEGRFKSIDTIFKEMANRWENLSKDSPFSEIEKQILAEFMFDPEAASRIVETIYKYPMSLKDCADIIETVGPLCGELTPQGFLYRLRNTRPFHLYLQT